jgi:hypothetical protein
MVDNTEQGAVDANAEGENKHGDGRESGLRRIERTVYPASRASASKKPKLFIR